MVASFAEITNKDGEIDTESANALLDRVMEEDADDGADKDGGEITADGGEKTENNKQGKDLQNEDKSGDDNERSGDDWVSAEDIRDLVESLGYSPEDMAEFGSRDEFDRHVRLMDRQFFNRDKEGQDGQSQRKPGSDQEKALEAGEEARKREEKRQRASDQPRENGRFARADESKELPKLDPEEFDERLIEVVQSRDEKISQLEQQIAELKTNSDASEGDALISQFDTLVDGLGHDDMFGNSEGLEPGSDHYAARSKLWDAVAVIANGMQANGTPFRGLSKSLIVRALNQEFGDQLRKKDSKKLQSKARRQASRRFGKGSERSGMTSSYDGPIYDDPELHAAHAAMEAENG